MPKTSKKRWVTGALSVDSVLAFVFGVVFLSTMLVFAIQFPNPTQFQLQVFVAALSLSAAGVGVVLPGVLRLEVKGLRAGGALGLVAIIWFTQPVIAKNVVSIEEPTAPIEPTISRFFDALDRRDAQTSFATLDPEALKFYRLDIDQWKEMLNANLSHLGTREWRRAAGTNTIVSTSQEPIGIFRQVSYFAKYSEIDACRAETLTLRGTQDRQWALFSYQISPLDVDCGSAPPA